MLDILGILISSGLILFIVLRAVRLDRQIPWFGDKGVEQRLPGWRQARVHAAHVNNPSWRR
jgi:hypothetical protein